MTNSEIESTAADKIEEDVKELANEMDVSAKVGLMGPAIGSLLSLGVGPVGFISGAAVGAFVIGIQRIIADKKRQEIQTQISELKNSDEERATELQKELNLIFPKNTQMTSAVQK